MNNNKKYFPVYKGTLADARKELSIDLYLDSKENEKWAGEIDIPENFNRGIDINSRYIIDGDVSILNEVVNELRAMI